MWIFFDWKIIFFDRKYNQKLSLWKKMIILGLMYDRNYFECWKYWYMKIVMKFIESWFNWSKLINWYNSNVITANQIEINIDTKRIIFIIKWFLVVKLIIRNHQSVYEITDDFRYQNLLPLQNFQTTWYIFHITFTLYLLTTQKTTLNIYFDQ